MFLFSVVHLKPHVNSKRDKKAQRLAGLKRLAFKVYDFARLRAKNIPPKARSDSAKVPGAGT